MKKDVDTLTKDSNRYRFDRIISIRMTESKGLSLGITRPNQRFHDRYQHDGERGAARKGVQ